jgi:phosphoglycolate phosphatase-like HAD superfamily hydrolase
MIKKLILFDIDGTLFIGKNEVHRKSFSVAIKKTFDIDANVDEIQTSGKTDTRIAIELLNKKGIKITEIRPRLKEIYQTMIEYVKENIESSNLIINPGVRKLLEELKSKNNVILGLLTGNLEEIAKLKLNKVGLLEFFQVGGFGEISENRERLAEEAIKKTEKKFDIRIDKKNVFYIGDAPLDIECGKSIGIKTIAIATGKHSKEELIKYNPDYFFADFSDLRSIINVIDSY